MVGCSDIWVGWSLHWAQLPNSSARWTPPGGLSMWPLVTMETLAGPGLRWGQLQDCKPGWSILLKNGHRGNSVCPLSTESHIQYASHHWMHHEWTQLRNGYRRTGISGKWSNILAVQHLYLSFLFPRPFSIPLSCSVRPVLTSFYASQLNNFLCVWLQATF